MNYNKVILAGRVTGTPEIRHTASSQVANFGLATNNFYKDKEGNKKEDVEFHNIVLWGKLAELAEKYIEKGQVILVEGRLATSSWEKDGKTFKRTDVIGESVQLGSKKRSE